MAQPITNEALERRRRQLLTAPTTGVNQLPEFERARQKTKAATGAKSRELNLQLQRQKAQAGGFGAGAGLKMGEQVRQQLGKEEAAQLSDIAAAESAEIGRRGLQREAMQLSGLEAERGREFQKGLFDIEQDFKERVFKSEEQNKLALLDLERQKQGFDEQTAAFNKIISALSLERPAEATRLLASLATEYNRPNQPPAIQALGEGLALYVNAANVELDKTLRMTPSLRLQQDQRRLDSIMNNAELDGRAKWRALSELINDPNLNSQVKWQANQAQDKLGAFAPDR